MAIWAFVRRPLQGRGNKKPGLFLMCPLGFANSALLDTWLLDTKILPPVLCPFRWSQTGERKAGEGHILSHAYQSLLGELSQRNSVHSMRRP